MYKERCEKLMRELQMTKKEMQQQHEEDLEQELASRKMVEKRVSCLSVYLGVGWRVVVEKRVSCLSVYLGVEGRVVEGCGGLWWRRG